MNRFEILTVAIQITSNLLLVLSVFYASRQFIFMRITNKQAHDWNRRKAAQDMCIRYSELNPNKTLLLTELGIYSSEKNGSSDDISLAELQRKFESNPKLKSSANTMLNYFEYLCIGIRQGVYDELVVKDFWQVIMYEAFQRLREYISEIRKDQPDAYELMELYSIKWKNDSNKRYRRSNVA